MQHLYPGCRFCEVTAICRKTQDECDVYYRYFDLDKVHTSSALNPASPVEKKTVEYPANTSGWINRLQGQVANISKGELTVQVTIRTGDNYIMSVMTLDRFLETGIREGDTVTVAVKAINVTVMK